MNKAVKFVIAWILYIPSFIIHIIPWLLYKIKILDFMTWSQWISFIPGQIGIHLRRVWYKMALRHCGKELTVDWMGVIKTPAASMGNHVYIGINSWVSWASIGDDVMLSGHILVLSGGNQHGIAPGKPMRLQEGKVQHIRIGKDVWIGAGARILADIADHSIVGTGAVVTKTFEKGDILTGIPAKPIKNRFK